MDLYRIIDDLMAERNRIDRIIRSLEESGPEAKPTKRRGRKFMDAAGRREVSERMRKYWAQRRKEQADGARSNSV
jgi:hypothetical protein